MRAKSRQILCIVLLPFVLSASVASLDALVLCTAEGHAAAVEVAHASRGICGSHDSHCCHHTSGSREKIGHDHVTCIDVPLRLNQGDVQDRRPIVVLEADAFVMEDLAQLSSESVVCLPGHYSSLEQLKFVVLLI